MGRGGKGTTGALQAGGRVRRERQASVWRIAVQLFCTLDKYSASVVKDAVAEQNQDRYTLYQISILV